MQTPGSVRVRQWVIYSLAGALGAWMLVRAMLGVVRLLSQAG